MSDSQQRRSRRPPNRSNGRSLPFVPIFIGVIILGFVIGAGLSLLGRSGQQTPVAAASSPTFSAEPVTPAPADSPAPSLAEAPSPEPSSTPRPALSSTAASANTSAAAAASPALETAAPDTSSSSASPVAADASPAATAKPAATPVARSATETRNATTSGDAGATRTAVRPPPPPPVVQGTRAAEASPDAATAPSPERTHAAPVPAAAAVVATATSAPAVTDDADTAFGKLAAGVVRGYLDAVARGDTDAAYSALGNSPGVSSGELTEQGIVTPSTRIKHVEARGTEDAATVNVDLSTPSGFYFGQYTVHRAKSGAAVIVQHTIFKS